MASVYLTPIFKLLETYVPNFHAEDASKVVDWFVAFRSPADLWANQPSFLLMEIMTICMVFLNYLHAKRMRGRFIYFWWATMVLSVFTECVCYFVPDLNNFWHAQSMVMFAGKRYPLYIVIIYNVFYYPGFVVASQLNLKWWAEPFAVGLMAVLIDVPYDILGVKMVWWSWHDTDPAILDRFYSVPWTSFHFHCAFSAALVAVFLGLKWLLTGNKWERSNFLLEGFCCVIAGLLGMPVGSLLFMIFYHPLKDNYGVHSEVPVLMFLGACMVVVWSADRAKVAKAPQRRGKVAKYPLGFNEVYITLVTFFGFFMALAVYGRPEAVRATGMHQTVGECGVKEYVFSMAGEDLPRDKYLCATNYSESYFDWHCLPGKKPPKEGSTWYTMCGTPFENRVEYVSIVWFFCVVGLLVFTQLFLFSDSANSAKQAKQHQFAARQPQPTYRRRLPSPQRAR